MELVTLEVVIVGVVGVSAVDDVGVLIAWVDLLEGAAASVDNAVHLDAMEGVGLDFCAREVAPLQRGPSLRHERAGC